MTKKNPWLGLVSYEEPKNDGNDYLFCGRDEETLDVVRLIDNNLFITLYGSSGIGKTSLLRAGVIPILRRKDYFPLYVRLSQEPAEISYAEAIMRKLQNSGLTVESGVAMKHADGKDRLYLWNYFATTRFMKDGREVYPVIILDQFEEVFREGDKAKAELLLKQIYVLLNDELEMPDEAGYSADTNYRFVASIREDFLFVLEDSIDENSLDLYKNNRYRLRPMKPEQARQVVLVPGRDCIEEGEKDKVTERIVALAKRDKRGDIDTLLLSLVCAGSFDKRTSEKITLSDLAIWKNNPMEVYYQDAIKGLSANQVRYVQQRLIRDDGSRRRVDAEDVKAALGETIYRQLTQGKNRLFAIGDKEQVELLHDQLGMAVWEERKAFEERERKKKMRQRVTAIGLVVLSIAGIFIFQNQKLKQQKWKMMENQARYIAKTANDLVDEGDSYTAQRLLLEVMPYKFHSNKPYTVEMEAALRKACTHNTAILKGHISSVNAIDISSDGKYIVSASSDNTVRLWDANLGIELKSLIGHTKSVVSVAFSPDDSHVVSSGCDSTIRIWNTTTGSELLKINAREAQINSVAFSPDGMSLVSSSTNNNISIWDVKTGKELKTMVMPESFLLSAIFSQDGQCVICASLSHIYIWNLESGQLKLFESLSERFSSYNSISINNTGDVIVSSSCVGNVALWDIIEGKLTSHINVPLVWGSDCVNSASFSPDGKSIVIASDDNTIRIFDIKSGDEIRRFEGHIGPVNYAAFTPDGKRIVSASSDQTIRIWDVETKEECKIIKARQNTTYFVNNVELYVNEGDTIIVWNDESKEYDTILAHTTTIWFANYSPDGRLVISASDDNRIRIWDVETGKLLNSIETFQKHITSVAISYDGRHIATVGDTTVRIWNVETGKGTLFYTSHQRDDITSVAFNPEGNQIAFVEDTIVHICDCSTGNELKTLYGHTDYVRFVTFSPNGTRIVTSSNDKTIRIWDSSTGNELKTLYGHNGYVNCVNYNPEGTLIVSASEDNTVRLWNAYTGLELRTLLGHTAAVSSVSFSPDSKFIVTASRDGTVNVWDKESGIPLQTFTGGVWRFESVSFKEGIESAFFSPNGRYIVFAPYYEGLNIVKYPPLQELIDQTRERFKDRPLTPEERRMCYLE